MVIDMNLSRITTLAQVRRFVDGLEPTTFALTAQAGAVASNPNDSRYEAIVSLLDRLHYGRRNKAGKSMILRLLVKLTGDERGACSSPRGASVPCRARGRSRQPRSSA